MTQSYCDACAETVLHLQHFVELALKDVLRSRHELLAAKLDDIELLDRILKGEAASVAASGASSVEAKAALDRIGVLLRKGRLGSRYEFIEEYLPLIGGLNALRNRLWHRGTFILRYRALDELMACHALPFLVKMIELPRYADFQQEVFGAPLLCGVAPFRRIVELCADGEFNERKVAEIAVLKECVAAQRENDAFEAQRQRYKRAFEADEPKAPVGDYYDCPACGGHSLWTKTPEAEVRGNVCIVRPRGGATCIACTFAFEPPARPVPELGLEPTMLEERREEVQPLSPDPPDQVDLKIE